MANLSILTVSFFSPIADNVCQDDYFRCKNGRCIPKRWQCDQEKVSEKLLKILEIFNNVPIFYRIAATDQTRTLTNAVSPYLSYNP